jgi:K+-transporting ATPase ATPase C chain
MLEQLRPAVLMLLVMTALTGGVYPLIVTGIAQIAFPHRANGSLIFRGDRPAGSELIGQAFDRPEYFWGRVSATAPVPYNAAASSGSNFGPLNPALHATAAARAAALRQFPVAEDKIPMDLVTASGSGLDPHISPAAAEFQIPRVAATREMSEEKVRSLVREHTEGRQFGVLGEPRVNVLRLNLALDETAAGI